MSDPDELIEETKFDSLVVISKKLSSFASSKEDAVIATL